MFATSAASALRSRAGVPLDKRDQLDSLHSLSRVADDDKAYSRLLVPRQARALTRACRPLVPNASRR